MKEQESALKRALDKFYALKKKHVYVVPSTGVTCTNKHSFKAVLTSNMFSDLQAQLPEDY